MKRGPPYDGEQQGTARRRGGEPPARGGGGYGYGDQPLPRGPYAFKVLCPESLTSFLLGSRGATKDQIQQETGTKMIFSNKGDYFPQTQFRVLAIYAEEVGCIASALEQVLQRIVELGDEEKVKPAQSGAELLGKEPGEYIFRLILSRQMAGLLIGSAGENVKRLRKETGAKVFIDNDTVMGHRLVRVIGPPNTISACLESINQTAQSDAETEEFQQYMRLLNFSDGWEGEHGGGGRAPSAGSRSGGGGGGSRGGGGGSGWGEGGWGDGWGSSGRGSRPAPERRTGPQVLPAGDARDLKSFPPGTPELSYTINCSIQASRVGALVGRSGDFVRRVEEETGAKVDIDRDGDGDTRQMSCTGPLTSIYDAHTRMMQRLQEIEAKEARERDRDREDDFVRGGSGPRRRGPSADGGGGGGEGGGKEAEGGVDPEALMAKIAEMKRQLDEATGGAGGWTRD